MINLERIEIGFKSNTDYYYSEMDGTKNNTVREIDWNDSRFPTLLLMKLHNNYGFIKISLPKEYSEKEICFVRQITNVCVWNNLMIITWEHLK